MSNAIETTEDAIFLKNSLIDRKKYFFNSFKNLHISLVFILSPEYSATCSGRFLPDDENFDRKFKMKLRGKFLRDAGNGNGLISSDSRQFEFSLETNWRVDANSTATTHQFFQPYGSCMTRRSHTLFGS